MSRNASQSAVDSQVSKQMNRKWSYDENVLLVSSMVDLHNIGSYNTDTSFKAGYLNELERMLARKLPNANIKAKPHIESRIKTLKKDWAIVYDMVEGDNTSGLDETVKETCSIHVIYQSHKDAAPFRIISFHFFNELCQIYAKDRVTGKNAQTTADIIEEIHIAGNDEGNDGRNTDFEDKDQTIHVSDYLETSFAPRTSTSSKKERQMR
ncbi:hypothetical protein PTKIN_Ptkin11bG0202300 [Pterospermum kingtungense]